MSVIINGGEINIEVKSSINIEVTGARGETGAAGAPAPERKILIFSYAFLGGQAFIATVIISNTFDQTPTFSCSEDGKLRLAFGNIQNKYPVWQILNRGLGEFTKGEIIHGDDSLYCVHDTNTEQGHFMVYVEFFEIPTTVISNI